jgi:hypothetical protein
MPRSDFDTEAYLSEIMKEAGDLPQSERAAVEKFFAIDGVKNYVADTGLRKQDYSRNTQAIMQQKKELDAKNAELQGWYEQQLGVVKQNQEEYERMQNQISAYKNEYGEINSNHNPSPQQTTPQFDPNKFIPREVHERDLDKIQKEGITLFAQMSTLQGRHLHEFKEPLDQESLLAFAQENHVTLKQAYDTFVSDRRQKRSDEDMKSKLEAAREEGRRSALSGVRLPGASVPTDMHPLEARANLGEKSNIPAWKTGVAAFLSGDLEKVK